MVALFAAADTELAGGAVSHTPLTPTSSGVGRGVPECAPRTHGNFHNRGCHVCSVFATEVIVVQPGACSRRCCGELANTGGSHNATFPDTSMRCTYPCTVPVSAAYIGGLLSHDIIRLLLHNMGCAMLLYCMQRACMFATLWENDAGARAHESLWARPRQAPTICL